MGNQAPVTTRANTSTSTRFAPALSSAREAALAVAPEVKTWSMSTTLSPRTPAPSAIRKAPWTFSALCARLKPTWLRVALTRRSAFRSHGLPVSREISAASAAAWLNRRRQSRKACSGTGVRRSASARTSAPAHPARDRLGKLGAVGIFEPMHERPGRSVLEARDSPGSVERRGVGHRLWRVETLTEVMLEWRAEPLAKGALDKAHRAPAAWA
jgi:hypothetical protein